jgi:hypothetical protein
VAVEEFAAAGSYAAGSFAAAACPDGQHLDADFGSVRHKGSAAAVDVVVVAEEYAAGEQIGAVPVCYLGEGSVVAVAAAASDLLEARIEADRLAEEDNAPAGVQEET